MDCKTLWLLLRQKVQCHTRRGIQLQIYSQVQWEYLHQKLPFIALVPSYSRDEYWPAASYSNWVIGRHSTTSWWSASVLKTSGLQILLVFMTKWTWSENWNSIVVYYLIYTLSCIISHCDIVQTLYWTISMQMYMIIFKIHPQWTSFVLGKDYALEDVLSHLLNMQIIILTAMAMCPVAYNLNPTHRSINVYVEEIC